MSRRNPLTAAILSAAALAAGGGVSASNLTTVHPAHIHDGSCPNPGDVVLPAELRADRRRGTVRPDGAATESDSLTMVRTGAPTSTRAPTHDNGGGSADVHVLLTTTASFAPGREHGFRRERDSRAGAGDVSDSVAADRGAIRQRASVGASRRPYPVRMGYKP